MSDDKPKITLKDFKTIAQYAEWLQGAGLPRREAEFIARKSWPAISGGEDEEAALSRAINQSIRKLKGRTDVR